MPVMLGNTRPRRSLALCAPCIVISSILLPLKRWQVRLPRGIWSVMPVMLVMLVVVVVEEEEQGGASAGERGECGFEREGGGGGEGGRAGVDGLFLVRLRG